MEAEVEMDDFNNDENDGGGEGDEAAENVAEDVLVEQVGQEQVAALQSQYEGVSSAMNQFAANVVEPLVVQGNVDQAMADMAQPAAPAQAPAPNPQYQNPNLGAAPGVSVPTGQYGNVVLLPPPGPVYDAPELVDENATASQRAAGNAAVNAIGDIAGGNDGARQTTAKRSVGMTVGLVVGALAGLAAPTAFILYEKLFKQAAEVNGSTDGGGGGGVGPSSTIKLDGPLNFGAVKVGANKPMTLTISNLGAQPITVSQITLPSGFTGTWSGTIEPGKSQDVTVVFAPTQAQVYAGNVIVTSDAMFGSNTTSVSGLGQAEAPAPAPAIGLAGLLDFGDVPTGQTRSSSLTLHNSGTAPLVVSGISAPAGFTVTWSGTIAPGAIQLVSVVFAPADVMAYGGTVTVSSNATAGTGTIAVSGNGIAGTGDPDRDLDSQAAAMVMQWNEQLDDSAFANALATWASTPSGTPPSLPSYALQLLVVLYAYHLSTHYVPPHVSGEEIETMATHLVTQRTEQEWDNGALYRAAFALRSPTTQVPLYRYESLNILARTLGLIIQGGAGKKKLQARN